jgi:flagellar biosynthetic protein FliP
MNLPGRMPLAVTAPLGMAAVLMTTWDANAQVGDFGALIPPGEGSVTARIVQVVALLTVLSIAPGLLIMVTSFTRFVVALSFLRSGLGLQSTPANLILISLALFMTFFVMAPTFQRAWDTGLQPLLDEQITTEEAFTRVAGPFREFMLAQVRAKDLILFQELAAQSAPAVEPVEPAPPPEAVPEEAETVELRILIPAFMISELRRGFEIGFLIVLPFLVIDLIVATLTMSMGMMMLPPTVLSLPFKILFFILIDGWNLLVGGLVRSYF